MRPIEKGSCPTNNEGGTASFNKYQQARGELIKRLGDYCSYCEIRLTTSPAVEHIQPKVSNPHLELEWTNFLLACPNCNSTKGDKNIRLADYYWADKDNTFRAFEYRVGGIVGVHSDLTASEKEKSQGTLNLTGLNKIPNPDPKMSDRRWMHRREAWDQATRALENLRKNDTLPMREQIVETALAKGFWSVWMTVFQHDSDMLNRFIRAFPGTCQVCFNTKGQPVARPGGAL